MSVHRNDQIDIQRLFALEDVSFFAQQLHLQVS